MSTYKEYKRNKKLKSRTFWSITIGILLVIITLITLPIVSVNQIDKQRQQLENEFKSDLNTLKVVGLDTEVNASYTNTLELIDGISIDTLSSTTSFADIKTSKTTALGDPNFWSVSTLLSDIVSTLNELYQDAAITFKGKEDTTPDEEYFETYLPGLKTSDGDYINYYDTGRGVNSEVKLEQFTNAPVIMKTITAPSITPKIGNIAIFNLQSLNSDGNTGEYIVTIDGQETEDGIWWESSNLNKDSVITITDTTNQESFSYTLPENVKLKTIDGVTKMAQISIYYPGLSKGNFSFLLDIFSKPGNINLKPAEGINSSLVFSVLSYSNNLEYLIQKITNDDDSLEKTFSNSYFVINSYLSHLDSIYSDQGLSERKGLAKEVYEKDSWQSSWDELMKVNDGTQNYDTYLLSTYDLEATDEDSLSSSLVSFNDFSTIILDELLLYDNSFQSTMQLIIDDALNSIEIFDLPYPF